MTPCKHRLLSTYLRPQPPPKIYEFFRSLRKISWHLTLDTYTGQLHCTITCYWDLRKCVQYNCSITRVQDRQHITWWDISTMSCYLQILYWVGPIYFYNSWTLTLKAIPLHQAQHQLLGIFLFFLDNFSQFSPLDNCWRLSFLSQFPSFLKSLELEGHKWEKRWELATTFWPIGEVKQGEPLHCPSWSHVSFSPTFDDLIEYLWQNFLFL